MVKKRATSNNSYSAASTKRKSAAARKQPADPSAKSSANAQRVISQAEIGHVAGEIWGLLSRDGGQSLAAVKKSVGAPSEIVLAAIGWLAREDKLEFSASGRTVTISLR